MALNTKYVVGINLNDYFVDKDTGLPLAGGKIFFKKDNNRSVGKFVYMLTGSPPNYTYTALPNPITLSSVGTVAVSPTNSTNVAVYFYPYDENGNLDLYYVQVQDSAGNIQLERQAWPNISANANPLNQVSGESGNQISNSQFIDILFEQEYGVTLPWTGAISNEVFGIAPGWDLIVSASGSGSIELNRLELAGSLNINTNPPYALDILPEGDTISSIKLRQKLQGNPSIFANNTLSGFMLIASLDGINHTISMAYSTSVPNVPKTVISADTGSTGYVNAVGTLDIGASLNTATAPDAATFIDIILPRTGHVAVSSIQVLPIMKGDDAASYIQDSVQRQESYLSYYYNPLIQQVPVPSILQGWDFKVNPAQFGSAVSLGAIGSGSAYLWDQLIGWQSTSNLLIAYRGAPRQLVVEHEAASGQIAIIQYISGPQLRQLLSTDFSVLIKAYTNRSGVNGTVSFWTTEDATLPSVAAGTNQSLIATIDANGKPSTFHGTWTEIARNYRGDGRFTIPYNASEAQTISIEGWNRVDNAINRDSTFGAIVVGFESYSDFHSIIIDSISVTPGLLARPVAPLSYELTLKELEYYYEKSYSQDIYAGTATSAGELIRAQASQYFSGPSNDYVIYYTQGFGIEYRSMKRTIPATTLYSPLTGITNNVCFLIQNVSNADQNWPSHWQVIGAGEYGISYEGLSGTGIESATVGANQMQGGVIRFHYTADARLGIVL